MNSAQRLKLIRLLGRRPTVQEHVAPLWKLKTLQPVQLVELAQRLEIDVSHLFRSGGEPLRKHRPRTMT